MKLLKTTKFGKGKGSHFHFVYLNEATQSGISSTDNKHSHSVSFSPPTPEMFDQFTGEVIPAQEGRWVFDGDHPHELIDLSLSPKKREENENLAKENRELFRVADGIEQDSRKKAIESEEYVMGKQWKKTDKDHLEAQDRAAITVNEIEAKVDLLSGYQRQNRSDFRFFPVEDGDGKVADLLNVVVKSITDQNDYEYEETDIFLDEVVTGRGNIHCYVDYKDDIRGEIKIEKFPWKDAYYGPHTKANGIDAEYVIKAKWYSLAKVKQLWPDKEIEIDDDFKTYGTSDAGVVTTGDQYLKPDAKGEESMTSFVNIAKKEYRVLEIERKEYLRIPVLADEGNDNYQSLEGMTEKEVNSVETIPDIKVIRQPETRIRKTIQAGDVILEDGDGNDSEFSLIPVYAKKSGNDWWGKVEGVKDVQLEINKRHSQSIDIINKNSAYGFFYDSSTFTGSKEKEKAKAELAKPGFFLEVQDALRPPNKVEGGKFPAELVNMMALDSQKIKELMNVNTEMLGQGGAYQSGYAMVEQKRQGLIGNEFLFDNLNRSKKRLGKKIVRLIQKVYSPERIYRIVENQNQMTPVELGGQPMENFPKEMIIDMLRNADLTKYDLAVSTSNFNPTTRTANFLIWADMAGKGAAIPMEVLVDLSDLPDKEKVKAAFARQQQAQKEEGQNKMKMEIGKTLIAKGVDPSTMMQDTAGPAI